MTWLDIFLLFLAAGFIFSGYKAGLIQAVGGLIGLFFGALIASRLYQPLAAWLLPWLENNGNVANIVAFAILFLFISRVIAFVFWILNKIFHFFAIVPGLKFINRIAGAALGLLEGALFLGVVLQFAVRLPLPAGSAEMINASGLAKFFLGMSGWLVPLLPSALRQSQRVIDFVLPLK